MAPIPTLISVTILAESRSAAQGRHLDFRRD
jgi:hypothetical protein